MFTTAQKWIFGGKEEKVDDEPCPMARNHPYSVYRDTTTNGDRFLKKDIRDRLKMPGIVLNHVDTPLKIRIDTETQDLEGDDPDYVYYGCGKGKDGVMRDCVYHMSDTRGGDYILCCPEWKEGGERTHYEDCKISDAYGEDPGMDLLGRAWLAKRKAFGQSTMGFEAGTPNDVWLTKISRANGEHRLQYLRENKTITDKQHSWKEEKRQRERGYSPEASTCVGCDDTSEVMIDEDSYCLECAHESLTMAPQQTKGYSSLIFNEIITKALSGKGPTDNRVVNASMRLKNMQTPISRETVRSVVYGILNQLDDDDDREKLFLQFKEWYNSATQDEHLITRKSYDEYVAKDEEDEYVYHYESSDDEEELEEGVVIVESGVDPRAAGVPLGPPPVDPRAAGVPSVPPGPPALGRLRTNSFNEMMNAVVLGAGQSGNPLAGELVYGDIDDPKREGRTISTSDFRKGLNRVRGRDAGLPRCPYPCVP